MELLQPNSRETETTLLHIPPQCSQKDLDDFITWIGDRGQSVEFRSRLGITDIVVDKLNLHCSTRTRGKAIRYGIIYDISHDMMISG